MAADLRVRAAQATSRAAVHGRITHRQHAQMHYPERLAKPLLAPILPVPPKAEH